MTDTDIPPGLAPDDDIPQTEPTGKRRGRPPKPRATKVDPSDLAPDIQRLRETVGTTTEYAYWIGCTHESPVPSVDIAGLNFPKLNALLVPASDGSNKRVHHPVVGAIVRITEAKFMQLRRNLRTKVMRMKPDKGQREEPGTGDNIGDMFRRPQAGHVVTIKTGSELEELRKAKMPAHAYQPSEYDRPITEFLFCHLCEDQVRPKRGTQYQPISEAGIEWPERLN